MSSKRLSAQKPAKSEFIVTLKKALLNFRALPRYFYKRYLKKSQPVESKVVFIVSFPRSGTHAMGSWI
jgi:hypothetical protein